MILILLIQGFDKYVVFYPIFVTALEDWILLLLHNSLRKGEHFDRVNLLVVSSLFCLKSNPNKSKVNFAHHKLISGPVGSREHLLQHFAVWAVERNQQRRHQVWIPEFSFAFATGHHHFLAPKKADFLKFIFSQVHSEVQPRAEILPGSKDGKLFSATFLDFQ